MYVIKTLTLINRGKTSKKLGSLFGVEKRRYKKTYATRSCFFQAIVSPLEAPYICSIEYPYTSLSCICRICPSL